VSQGSNLDQFELKERIRQSTDIVELIGGYGEMRRQGRNWVTRCPWHDDRRPSLQVNPARQSWKCWVCDLGGDVFSFLMKREGIDFPDAMRILADKAGIAFEAFKSSGKSAENRDQRNAMFQAMQWAVGRFHAYLQTSPDAQAARDYLHSRGLLQPAIEAFEVGYAPNEWSWLTDQATGAGHDPATLKLIGVAQERNNGGFYDFYRGRIIFPIFDTQNRAISLGGRILPEIAKNEEAQGRNAAKYINGPETKIYSKSDNLYGLNLVKANVEKSRHLVIVEGYTDVTMAWQAGLDNVVAVQGTALNERHIRLIKRFADRVSLVLDGDEAGINRSNDILNLFVAADMDLRIMTPPDGLDPCDFLLQNSASKFKELLDEAKDALEYKIQRETAGFDPVLDTSRAHQAIENILSTIAQTPKSLVIQKAERQIREQQLMARLARRFQVSQDTLINRLEEIRTSRRPNTSFAAKDSQVEDLGAYGDVPTANTELTTLKPPKSWDWKQREVLELLMLQPDFLELIVERIPAEWFAELTPRTVYDLFCGCYEDGIPATFEHLSSRSNDPAIQNILVSLDLIAQEKSEASNQAVEERMSTVMDWFYVQEVKASQRKTLAELEERKLSEDQELAQLQVLIQQERQRQGIRVPTDG